MNDPTVIAVKSGTAFAPLDDEELRELRKAASRCFDDRARRELNVGYSGYEPFVEQGVPNSVEPRSAIRSVVAAIAADLKVELNYIKTDWTNGGKLLQDSNIDLMLEPIIPTRSRSLYSVVPYMQIGCGALVVPAKLQKNAKRFCLASQGYYKNLYDEGQAGFEVFVDGLQRALHDNLPGMEIGVTGGVIERDIAEFVAKTLEYPEIDIVSNIIDCVNKGKLFLADKNSALIAQHRPGGPQFQIFPLLSEDFSVPCGFPVNGTTSFEFSRYLHKFVSINLLRIQEVLKSNTPTGTFEDRRFSFLKQKDFPIRPIIGAAISSLLVWGRDINVDVPEKEPTRLDAPRPTDQETPLNHPVPAAGVVDPLPDAVNEHKVLLDGGVWVTLPDYLLISDDNEWKSRNERRLLLIDQESEGMLSAEELAELEHLQELLDARRALTNPLPWSMLRNLERLLKKNR